MMSRIGAIEIPPTLNASVERDAPFVIETDSALVAEATRRAHRQDLVQETFGSRRTVVVPLTVGGSLDGILSLVGRPGLNETAWDAADLAVAGEVGARVAAVIAAERARERQTRLHRTSAALAAADTLDEVARVLVEAVAEAFGASAQSVTVVAH